MAAHVDETGALLTVDDPQKQWEAVSLWYHLRRPYPDRSFQYSDGQWRYWLDRPPVDRLEYLIETTGADGSSALVLDESNPATVAGVFGEHSVLEFPGYHRPWWVADLHGGASATHGTRVEIGLPHAHGLRRDLPVELWTPDGVDSDATLPLLLVHDGTEMDRLAAVTSYATAMARTGRLPAFRIGLLSPPDRDAWYSASPAYARSLATTAVPALLDQVPTLGRPVLAGASLGALAALHAEWAHPGTFAGLYLASGSFFQVRFDEQESGHARFLRICSAVEWILDAATPWTAAKVALTCGRGEENWENNQAMVAALRRAGVTATFSAFADGHTWVGWRDSLDPALTDLLATLWR